MQPFTVRVADEVLDDLRDRLRRARWPDELPGLGWTQGTDAAFLRALVQHWQSAYDWRAAEREINRLHHFRAEIGGQAVHFIHQRSGGLPLLLTHGWPGSFHEFSKAIPLLAAAGFDVVVPSLPGYAFSTPLSRAGINAFAIADLWAELMTRLGYARFAAQGGDWGASVSTCLGLRHPQRLLGLHLNYIPGSYFPDLAGKAATAEEQAALDAAGAWSVSEGAYGHQQRTRPQTLGFALEDSPVGLAAWMVEKFRAWSDCGGEVERRFSRDELITQVMIYWVTRSATSAARLYLEGRLRPLRFAPGEKVRVPCAIARFPREEPFPPRSWIERGYQVARYTELPRGGHFAAWEEPELLVDDLRAFLLPR
jgi:pimeloyl-ACP methyl ester carboxylesterase